MAKYRVTLPAGSWVFDSSLLPFLKIRRIDGGVSEYADKFLGIDSNGDVLPMDGGSGAPADAEYLVKSSNGDLSAERVVTDTATVTWDFATSGQAKASVPNLSGTNSGDETASTILLKLLTVDGAASNIDADLLDGLHAAAFALVGATMYIGTTALALNRASGAVALTGITSIDGNAATVTTNANLTGDVTSTGNATTIGNKKVTLAKMDDLAQSTIIGRAAAAGTGVPTALTATQVRTLLALTIGTDVQAWDADLDALASSGSNGSGAFARVGSPTFTGNPIVPTQAAGTNNTRAASTAYVRAAVAVPYKPFFQASASHTAGKVAGTYALTYGAPAAVGGTGTLAPLASIYIDPSDFPAPDGMTTKLRIAVQLYTNDTAPTGNFTFGLYPITRPGVSGGAGLCTFTIGSVVTGSNGASFTAPAVDGLLAAWSSDFDVPTAGHYVIAFVSTATVAASAHVHMQAQLSFRYV